MTEGREVSVRGAEAMAAFSCSPYERFREGFGFVESVKVRRGPGDDWSRSLVVLEGLDLRRQVAV
jgi:hypothetical protein